MADLVKDGSLNFTGMRSGIKLSCFTGYPANFPQLQVSEDQRLCFWDWNVVIYGRVYSGDPLVNPNRKTQPFASYYGILYSPTGEQVTAGYDNVPLPPAELARFLSGGRKAMMFQNVVVKVNDVYCWKYVDGWAMLWNGVQYFIDTFLKVPYNVRELVYGNDSYPNLFKDQLWESKHLDKLTNILGNINFFFPPPPGKPGFFDKFAQAFPVIWATALSIVTAGAGTPAIVGVIGALAAKYAMALQKNKDQQQLVDQYEKWKLQNPDNIDKGAVQDATGKSIIDKSVSPWAWIAMAAAAVFLYKSRKRKKR